MLDKIWVVGLCKKMNFFYLTCSTIRRNNCKFSYHRGIAKISNAKRTTLKMTTLDGRFLTQTIKEGYDEKS